MTMKLSTRLVTSFAAIAAVLFIVGIANFFSLRSIGKKQMDMLHATPLVDAAMEMKLSVAQDMQMIMELLASENNEELETQWEQHLENVERFDIFADGIVRGAETDEGTIYATKDQKLVKLVKEADGFHNKEFQENIKKIYSIMGDKLEGKKVNRQALSDADQTADAVGEQIFNMLGEIEDAARLVIKTSKSETESVSFVASIVSISGIMSGLILAIILGITTTRRIAVPINGISVDLGDAAEQVAAASEQVATASQKLSEASSEQASSIEETSSSLEELTGMVNNNVENSEKTTELADNMAKISDQGNESMASLIHSMEEILMSNEKIQDLVKVIGEIGEKTAVIDEIVFQTKLLSFNASVEAERAGEHGRGFAVVAQEVGNLAQMSGKAATEISSIVKRSLKEAEVITIENKKKVDGGNDLVRETAKILKEISQNSAVVSQSAAQILTASKEQASGISQINDAITQLDKATQENASTSEEAASSSEELSAQAGSLNTLVADLTQMVSGTRDGRRDAVYGFARQREQAAAGGRNTRFPRVRHEQRSALNQNRTAGHPHGLVKHVDSKAFKKVMGKKSSPEPVEAMAFDGAEEDGAWDKL